MVWIVLPVGCLGVLLSGVIRVVGFMVLMVSIVGCCGEFVYRLVGVGNAVFIGFGGL